MAYAPLLARLGSGRDVLLDGGYFEFLIIPKDDGF
jgi:hypothetical protein